MEELVTITLEDYQRLLADELTLDTYDRYEIELWPDFDDARDDFYHQVNDNPLVADYLQNSVGLNLKGYNFK
ncbi:MAG: hypothetical protein ACRCXK_10400 [Wohlfahrtiimonas sp.]